MGVDKHKMAVESGDEVGLGRNWPLMLSEGEAEQGVAEGLIPFDMFGDSMEFVVGAFAGEDLS